MLAPFISEIFCHLHSPDCKEVLLRVELDYMKAEQMLSPKHFPIKSVRFCFLFWVGRRGEEMELLFMNIYVYDKNN